MQRCLPIWFALFATFFGVNTRCQSISMSTVIDSGGLRGNVSFTQQSINDPVKISVHLTSLSSKIQLFDWAIHEFPVIFDRKNPCVATELGKSLHDFSRAHGQLALQPGEDKSAEFESTEVSLNGPKTIWGRSLYMKSSNTSARACSNIRSDSDKPVRTAIASFTKNVAGNIVFRENEFGQTTIFSNLFYTTDEYRSTTNNDWRLLVTDILDHNDHYRCNQLHLLFDPYFIDDANCTDTDHLKCKIGDMTRKHGQIIVGNNNNRYSKKFMVDTHLQLEYLESTRKFFIVIQDKNNPNKPVACGEIQFTKPKEVKAHFSMGGVKGEFVFKQDFKTEPTLITVKLSGLHGQGRHYRIHEFPFSPRHTKDEDICGQASVGDKYNPYSVDRKLEPFQGSNDMYAIGDLSGKHGPLSELQDIQHYFNIHLDFNLPLFGVNSIVGRSIVIYSDDDKPWVCANIGFPEKTRQARAVFHFPVVGEIIFRQVHDEPFGDTVVFGSLTHSETAANASNNHQWRIHEFQTGKDFYNWTRRCYSTGDVYNPYRISTGKSYSQCNNENHARCQLGDLTAKFRKLQISSIRGEGNGKFFYTDTLLPLSGEQTIIAHSLVIEDENGPQARGKRLACTTIRRQHSQEAMLTPWRTSSGIVSNITGTLKLFQETEFDATHAKIDIKGLRQLAATYHVHKASVPLDKEFPCSADTVYGHYNPFEVDSSIGPFPAVGSVDQYEAGDLSGKHGLLNSLDKLTTEYDDTNLPLMGVNSIIGRSVVVHKRDNNFRWSCASIVPKVDKTSREILAIASFSDPRSFVYGFIKFRQVEFFDGSLSDTWIEVSLRHRDKNKKMSYGHKWNVFVNQVGSDAFNHVDSVRCVAGAFPWNPYFTTIGEFYSHECSPKLPLKCTAGDLGGRNGPLMLGGERQVFSDPYFPLAGNFSALNRALIIYMHNGSNTVLACANIKLDKHLISNVIIQKIPAFTVQKFMVHIREILSIPEFLAVAEVQRTREISNNECIQILVHFYGDEAWRYQSEFNNLVEHGSVKHHNNGSLLRTYYKSCKNKKPENGASSQFPGLVALFATISLFTVRCLFN